MLSGLMLTAFLMGLGGIPHCAAMCGAPCAAALRAPVPAAALLGRAVSYGFLGVVAAASGGWLKLWAGQVALLQPLWLLAQMAALLLGLWLLATGQMPGALEAAAQRFYHRARTSLSRLTGTRTSALLPFVAGLAWVVVPCGLLYGALMVAALADTALQGGAVMIAFALPSALGVWAAPWIMSRLGVGRPVSAAPAGQPVAWPTAAPAPAPAPLGSAPIIWLQPASEARAGSSARRLGSSPEGADGVVPASAWIDPRWAVRLAGVTLALMSAWAVSHRAIDQWRAWCA